MNRRRFLKRSAVVGVTFVGATPLGIPWLPSCRAAHDGPLRPLRKLYLSMHSLCWADCVASDPRRKTPRWEQFDGRCELAYRKDLEVEKRLHRLIRTAMPDEGFLIVPNGLNNEPEKRMIALAREHFGDRCAVDDGRTGEGFDRGLDEDLRQTVLQRGPQWENPQSLPPGREFEAWRGAKRMAVALQAILLEQGYSFDPQTVEMESLGDDWMGCAATYPIQIAGAWGLAKGVDRRFDLGISDESPLFLKVEPVEQNLPMPENVRLFLFKTPDEPPTRGRYIAQFWEGRHRLQDPPHRVTVDFPEGTVREINIFGWETKFSQGTMGSNTFGWFGRAEMSVGCGGHTPHHSTLVIAERLSLESFRAALLAANVGKKPS